MSRIPPAADSSSPALRATISPITIPPTTNPALSNIQNAHQSLSSADWQTSNAWAATEGSTSGTAEWEDRADVQEAIIQSAQSRPTMASDPPVTPKRSALDARIADLASSLAWLIPSSKGDTLVYIDPPAFQGRQDLDHVVALRAHLGNPFRIESKRIEDLHSPFFAGKLKGKYQSFIRIKRGLKNLPADIKYVIDLTPKSEGDEAVQYLEDLSCPAGVLSWAGSTRRFQVSSLLVLGRDEFTPQSISHKKRRSTDIKKEPTGPLLEQSGDGQTTSEEATQSPTKDEESEKVIVEHVFQPLGKEPEYTQARHRLAIERFLLALQGQDPRFDSAVKLYTTVMVSKAFDIRGQNPLTDYVVRWLYCEPNSCFIEVLPEVTLQMAEVIRHQGLASDSFAVLVGEAVLDNAMHHNSANETLLGRRRGAIDETWQSRLEYARNALIDRVQNTFDTLAGDRMDWVDSLETLRWLKGNEPHKFSPREQAYQSLSELLKTYLRGAIYHVLCSNYFDMGSVSNRNGVLGDDLYPTFSLHNKWHKISPQARVYTWSFWNMLSFLRFEEPDRVNGFVQDFPSNLSQARVNRTFDGIAPNSMDIASTSLYQSIKYTDLAQAVMRCQSFLGPNEYAQQTLLPRERCNQYICLKLGFNLAKCQSCLKRFCSDHRSPDPRSPSHHFCRDWDISTQMQLSDSSQDAINDTSQAPVPGSDPLRESPTAASTAIEGPGIEERKWVQDLNVDRNLQASRELPASSLGGAAKWLDNPSARRKVEPSTTHATPLTSHIGPPISHAELFAKYDEPQPPSYEAFTTEAPLRLNETIATIMSKLMGEIRTHIEAVAQQMTARAQGGELGEGGAIQIAQTSTLVCLGEDEIKYLPLWAGGLDDGTSGVYNAQVPLAADGFKGPPAKTDELSIYGLGEAYDMADDRKTIATSAVATDGYGDALHRDKVYAMSEAESVDWDFVPKDVGARTKGKSADGSATEGVSPDSRAATPTVAKKIKDIDILDDVFFELDDAHSDNDIMNDDSGDEEDQMSNQSVGKDEADSPESYVLETESVSYGGFSDPETSPVEAHPSTSTTSSTKPNKHFNGFSEEYDATFGNTASTDRTAANEIGSELRSAYANVYYIYKDGPEEDPLLTRP